MGKRITLLGMMILSVLLIVVIGREKALTVVFGPIEQGPIDFSNLVLGPKPNQFLVCPAEYCTAKPHLVSPVFALSADALRQRWMTMIETLPRIEKGAFDDQTLQYDFVQRSALMRYPDSITVRFIALNDAAATLAIYSRSHYGHSDLGVNEDRVRAWLLALEKP